MKYEISHRRVFLSGILISGLLLALVGISQAKADTIAQTDHSTQLAVGETTYYMTAANLGAAEGGDPSSFQFVGEQSETLGTNPQTASVVMWSGCGSNTTTSCEASSTYTHITADDIEVQSLGGGVGLYNQYWEGTGTMTGNIIWQINNDYGTGVYGTSTVIFPGNVLTGDSNVPSTGDPYFQIEYTAGEPDCDVPVGVDLTYPAPSSTIYNNFAQWAVSTPSLLEGCTYNLQVIMTPDIGSLTGTTDQATISTSPTSLPTSVNVTKVKNIWNYWNATTTQINYTVVLINQFDNVVIGSQAGSFYLAYNATTSAATAPPNFVSTDQCGGVCTGFGTIGGGSITTETSTIAATGAACTAPDDGLFSFFTGADLLYASCETLNWLFVPNASTQAILTNDQDILEGVPPFSWFFQTNAEIQAVANGDTSYVTPGGSAVYTVNPNVSTTPNNGIGFTIFTGINGATNTITLLPANPLSNTFLADGRLIDDWYNLVLTFCVIFVIIMLYKIIL
jgi:hypothetical protein